MRNSLALLILSISAFVTFGQEQDSDSIVEPVRISSSYVPDHCFDSTLYIEKFEEIPFYELSTIIAEEDRDSKKDQVIESVEFYNSVSVLKYNQLFEEISATEKKLSISTLYKADHEKLPKYSIVSMCDFAPYLRGNEEIMYAIYDNENDTRYAYFSSLDVLFAAVRASKTYMDQAASRNQDDLDAYLNKKVSSLERKAESKGGGGGNFWLIFAGVLSLAVIIANLVTL